MTYQVHAVEQDLASKWYARVCITEEEAVFLKFDDYPTMDAIQDAASAWVAARDSAHEGLVRARDEFGRFISDDPGTPDINEAWVDAPTE